MYKRNISIAHHFGKWRTMDACMDWTTTNAKYCDIYTQKSACGCVYPCQGSVRLSVCLAVYMFEQSKFCPFVCLFSCLCVQTVKILSVCLFVCMFACSNGYVSISCATQKASKVGRSQLISECSKVPLIRFHILLNTLENVAIFKFQNVPKISVNCKHSRFCKLQYR